VLFGAVASPSHPVAGYRSPIVGLRRALDLYANIRPVQARGDLRGNSRLASAIQGTTQRAIDFVVVRENTEGLYAGRERVEDAGDTAITERVITRRASERIVRAAFELARERAAARDAIDGVRAGADTSARPYDTARAPKVTIVHKANVLRETCGLFRRVALEVAAEYPDIAHDELLVDTCALQLIQQPERFDVLVTTNLFGDILSDVGSYWGGGLGLATSANIGTHNALFEPVHGAAPDIAGKGIANPLAAIGCVAMMLEYLARNQLNDARYCVATEPLNNALSRVAKESLLEWASRIRAAVDHVTQAGPHTPDLGGNATTAEVTQAVITAI
jgi:homoisocitrate dehydrogenase